MVSWVYFTIHKTTFRLTDWHVYSRCRYLLEYGNIQKDKWVYWDLGKISRFWIKRRLHVLIFISTSAFLYGKSKFSYNITKDDFFFKSLCALGFYRSDWNNWLQSDITEQVNLWDGGMVVWSISRMVGWTVVGWWLNRVLSTLVHWWS